LLSCDREEEKGVGERRDPDYITKREVVRAKGAEQRSN
jgi:hypothetical protein